MLYHSGATIGQAWTCRQPISSVASDMVYLGQTPFFVPYPGDEETAGWYIPRPALCRAENTTCSCTNGQASIRAWLSSPPPSSNTSTQSGSSGSLLLTAANLAALRLEPTATKEADATSLASSTHFTMINYPGYTREKRQSICARHHVSAIVLSMSALFLIGLIAAIYYIDMRSSSVRYS